MKAHKRKAVTLLELIIGMTIFSIIVLAISQLDFFSQASIIDSQQRTLLANDVSLAMEHISKNLDAAIGDVNVNNEGVSNADIAGFRSLSFWVDGNANFMRDAGDTMRSYRWTAALGAAARRFTLYYCANCQIPSGCVVCNGPNEAGGGTWGVPVARNIVYFGEPYQVAAPVQIQGNVVSLEIRACRDTASLGTCGGSRNPQVNMIESICLPSVSAN